MKQVLSDGLRYTGFDVVQSLISSNNERFGNESVTFACMNGADEEVELPSADMVIARQVLQHLDNASIHKLLLKFSKYKYVLITEHIYVHPPVPYNVDKIPGPDIRRSGVLVDSPPFSLAHTAALLMVPSWPGTFLRTTLTINQLG